MKKLLLLSLFSFLIIACNQAKSLSEDQINDLVISIEKDGLESIDGQNLDELELEFSNCFRQCRKTFKSNKPPLKITIGDADMQKYNVSGVEYNRQSYTDSDNLYNAYITIVRAYCIDGCTLNQPFAEKASEEYAKYNEAFNKLMEAKAAIEKAKQAESADD